MTRRTAEDFDKLVEMAKEHNTSPKQYIVRLYDGFDNLWIDVSGPLSQDEALKKWNEETDNGRRATQFGDIDYYRIFPADTEMFFSAVKEPGK